MKISILVILLTSFVSLSGFAADPNLDPNLVSGFSGAGSADMIQYNAEAKPESPECETCYTSRVARHALTAAKKGVSTTTTPGAPAAGADSSGNNGQ